MGKMVVGDDDDVLVVVVLVVVMEVEELIQHRCGDNSDGDGCDGNKYRSILLLVSDASMMFRARRDGVIIII
jgi:hypothetical protein